MNHTTIKKIALVLSITLGIHSTTQCFVWNTDKVAIAVFGAVMATVGVTIVYFKFIRNSGQKEDILKTTPKEECTTSRHQPQPAEETPLLTEHQAQVKPTPAVEKNTPPIPAPVKTQPITPKPAPVAVTPTVVAIQRSYELYHDEALRIGSFNDPFNN